MREGAEQSESRCMPGADMQTYGELHVQISSLPPFQVRRERNIVNISVQSSQGSGLPSASQLGRSTMKHTI
jgi:hypothetical protein